mgnify:CR=1 FL=1
MPVRNTKQRLVAAVPKVVIVSTLDWPKRQQQGINMAGKTNLEELLSSIAPRLSPISYVFCCVQGSYGDFSNLKPLASFAEDEGLTLVIPENQAMEHNLAYESTFSSITLTVHSSLDAVGLTAAVAQKLAHHGISANVIAAYYHDHIFVQTEKAELAMAALQEFKQS